MVLCCATQVHEGQSHIYSLCWPSSDPDGPTSQDCKHTQSLERTVSDKVAEADMTGMADTMLLSRREEASKSHVLSWFCYSAAKAK